MMSQKNYLFPLTTKPLLQHVNLEQRLQIMNDELEGLQKTYKHRYLEIPSYKYDEKRLLYNRLLDAKFQVCSLMTKDIDTLKKETDRLAELASEIRTIRRRLKMLFL